jgi:hypothetical protein
VFGESLVTLPRGLFDHDGRRHATAVLRPVTGRLEIQLAEHEDLDASAVSELLASAISRIGGYRDITPEHTAALSRGDRDYAIMQLRRSLFGDNLDLVVTCANPSCREDADLRLQVADLAPEPASAAPEIIRADTALGLVLLREPTGADDEAVAGRPQAEASAMLWSRLILDLAGTGSVTENGWKELDASVRHNVALALADGQSGPSLAFTAPCPSCGAWMEIELDAPMLLAAELGVATERLFAEVHLLAYGYHWSQDEILSLPREHRWRYLELLRRQAEGRPLIGTLQ